MNPVVTPLHPLFVARLRESILGPQIDETTQRAIEGAMDMYAVRVLPGQHLEDEKLIAFSRLYGPLEVEPEIGRKVSHPRCTGVSSAMLCLFLHRNAEFRSNLQKGRLPPIFCR
jgi:alpha-ketoglutarate-dependent taurine dioxygenase